MLTFRPSIAIAQKVQSTTPTQSAGVLNPPHELKKFDDDFTQKSFISIVKRLCVFLFIHFFHKAADIDNRPFMNTAAYHAALITRFNLKD